MSWAAAIPSLLQIAAGVQGNQQANQQSGDAANTLAKNRSLYEQLLIPSIEDQRLDLQQYTSAGNLVNKEDVAEQLAMQDALQNINLDPRLKQTQMDQLNTLQKIAGSGFTPDELYAMDTQRGKNEADVTSRLKQLQQQQDMRGMGNSDLALASRMQEAQSGANRSAEDARAQQALGFKRSLEAITQAGNLAGNIDQTDYNRQAALAQNLNQREATNLNQRSSVNRSNVDRFNQALASNLQNQQNIMNQNTGLANTQQQFNKGLAQTQFQNQLQKIGGITGANTSIAKGQEAGADRTRDLYGGVANSIGQFGQAFINSDKAEEEKTKKSREIA